MEVTLVQRHILNPDLPKFRLDDNEYYELVDRINKFIMQCPHSYTKVIFCSPELDWATENHVEVFDSDVIVKSTAKQFKKELKKNGYKFDEYHSYDNTHYFHVFEIDWTVK